jgi:hypothetical protein
MLNTALTQLFERDLNSLKKEIESYTDEPSLWIIKDGISNSAGNLCLHLIGNLNHFIGATLGKTGYVRERDKEFSQKNIPRNELITNIDKTLQVVKSTIETLTVDDFNGNFPIEFLGKTVKTDFMLINLVGHLSYHLGQINYHRRLLSEVSA